VLRVANWMRAFGANSQTGNWLVNSTSATFGQSPLTSPSVFNFWRPGFVPAGTTQLGQRNLVAPEFQAVNEVSTANYINGMNDIIANGMGSTPPGGTGRDVRTLYAGEMGVADNATALVDRMNRLLFYGQMSSTQRTRMTDAINAVTIPSGTATQAQIDAAKLNRVRIAVLTSMASPEYLIQR
jgi:hypothetical protein